MKKSISSLLTIIVTLLTVVPVYAFSEQDQYVVTQIISNGFDNENNTQLSSMVYFGDHYYVGTYNDTQGVSLYRSTEDDGN